MPFTPRPRSRLAVSVTSVLAAAALAACGSSHNGGSGASAGNRVAAKSADGIVKSAAAALKGARSVHVSGSLVTNGMPLTLDLNLLSGKGGNGSMSENGLGFQIIAVNHTIYIKGSDAFWKHFGGATAAQLFHGKWLKAPASGQFAPLAALANLQQLSGKLLASQGKFVKGATTTVDGQPAVAVTDTTQGGTLYVATTGTPYPVEVIKKGTGGGHITFDHYNETVTLTPPANAIDASKVG